LAAREIWPHVPNAYFLFAVSADDKNLDYERKVRGMLGDDGRVRFLESIPHERMGDFYRLADVTISIPSSDGTPLSVLESLACGTSVLVSNIPNYDPDYIEAGKTVLMAESSDVASIVSSLTRMLSDATLRQTLASEGRRRVEAYGSYEAQMTRMEDLYYALVKRAEFRNF